MFSFLWFRLNFFFFSPFSSLNQHRFTTTSFSWLHVFEILFKLFVFFFLVFLFSVLYLRKRRKRDDHGTVSRYDNCQSCYRIALLIFYLIFPLPPRGFILQYFFFFLIFMNFFFTLALIRRSASSVSARNDLENGRSATCR